MSQLVVVSVESGDRPGARHGARGQGVEAKDESLTVQDYARWYTPLLRCGTWTSLPGKPLVGQTP